MLSLPAALGRSVGQLTDPAILKVLAKSIAITLVLLLVAGGGIWFAFAGVTDWLLEGSPDRWLSGLLSALGAILGLLSVWLLIRIVALAVVQFFADEIVQAVERKHYPEARSSARSLDWREELANSAKSTGRTILVNLAALIVAIPLLLTAIGPAILFFVVNAWLLGRELLDLAWIRHRHSVDARPPIGALERLLLGATIAGLLLVPFVNLLAPVIGAAAACHLVHRKKGTAMAANPDAA